MDIEKIEAGFRQVMEGLGLDLNEPHFRDSPRRSAEAWRDELCAGLREPAPSLEIYPFEEGTEPGMIAVRHIPVKSLCAHHLLPFMGQATVAYLPGAGFCALSHLSKVVNHFARRPQLQENLTYEIARFLQHGLQPRGVGVIVTASHYCMEMRGVNHPGEMTTSSLLGAFQHDPAVHAEFMVHAAAAEG